MFVNHALKRRKRRGAQIVCGAQAAAVKKQQQNNTQKTSHLSRCKQSLILAAATPWKKGWHFGVWLPLFSARRSRFKQEVVLSTIWGNLPSGKKNKSRRILRLYTTEVAFKIGVYFRSLAGTACVSGLFALQSKQQGRRRSYVSETRSKLMRGFA